MTTPAPFEIEFPGDVTLPFSSLAQAYHACAVYRWSQDSCVFSSAFTSDHVSAARVLARNGIISKEQAVAVLAAAKKKMEDDDAAEDVAALPIPMTLFASVSSLLIDVLDATHLRSEALKSHVAESWKPPASCTPAQRDKVVTALVGMKNLSPDENLFAELAYEHWWTSARNVEGDRDFTLESLCGDETSSRYQRNLTLAANIFKSLSFSCN